MDKSELAKLMLQWETAQARADEIKAAIVDAVMELQETQSAGNVRATYSGGRKTYDYQAVGSDAPAALVKAYTTEKVVVNTDYRKLVLDGMKVEQAQVPFTQSEPSVTVKLAA